MILDLIRKQASFKMVSLSNVPEPSDENEYEACPPPPQDVLLKLISELPVERRTVFNMYCLEGYSHKEIANRLGITEKGSASILSKARAQLRERIIKYDKDGQSVG